MKKFISTNRKGFHMTFENGLTVSVQWGAGNYCDNYGLRDYDAWCGKDMSSDTAEVAVMREGVFLNTYRFLNGNGFMHEGEEEPELGDAVVGRLTPERVVDLLVNVKNWTADRNTKIKIRRRVSLHKRGS